MPELPEIETLRRTLAPRLEGQRLVSAIPRRAGLRWPFPDFSVLLGCPVLEVARRSKYLLLRFAPGTLLIHLGMSGSLSWAHAPPGRHDHLDLVFSGQPEPLRLHDPRRFGAVVFQPAGTLHPALSHLGPEPLTPVFTGAFLHERLAGRKTPVKVALMDPEVVVGVGNIYATEALFRARIDPRRPAGRISLVRYKTLASHVQDVLREGIAKGGSTLRDFHGIDGEIGTFPDSVQAYGRAGQPCVVCDRALSQARLGGRSSVFCAHCQH